MEEKKHLNFISSCILVTYLIVLFISCNNKDSDLKYNKYVSTADSINGEVSDTFKYNLIAVEAPPFTEGIFPCNDCHSDMEPNSTRRQLIDKHDDIEAIFDHDSENRWCLNCHDLNYEVIQCV